MTARQQGTNDEIELTDANRLRRRVFNLEVDEFHTYYVGEMGVWVHDTNCAALRHADLKTAS